MTGARLCTVNEITMHSASTGNDLSLLQQRVLLTDHTWVGCNFDFANKVSGSPCSTSDGNPGLVVVPEPGGAISCAAFDASNETFAVRCCADEEAPHVTVSNRSCSEIGFPDSPRVARTDVCGASTLNGKCFPSSNFSQAQQACSNIGARVCTFGELVSGIAQGTG